MLVIDDILLFPFSFGKNPILPNYLTLVFQVLHKLTMEGMYPLDRIKNAIKENRMLFEFNEVSKKKYEEENARLIQLLNKAQKIRDMSFGVQMQVYS